MTINVSQMFGFSQICCSATTTSTTTISPTLPDASMAGGHTYDCVSKGAAAGAWLVSSRGSATADAADGGCRASGGRTEFRV